MAQLARGRGSSSALGGGEQGGERCALRPFHGEGRHLAHETFDGSRGISANDGVAAIRGAHRGRRPARQRRAHPSSTKVFEGQLRRLDEMRGAVERNGGGDASNARRASRRNSGPAGRLPGVVGDSFSEREETERRTAHDELILGVL